MTILVAGGATANGASFVLHWISEVGERVINVDSVAHGKLEVLESLAGDPRHVFVLGDVSESRLLDALLLERKPRAVVHFTSAPYMAGRTTNSSALRRARLRQNSVVFNAAHAYWKTLPELQQAAFRFLRVGARLYGEIERDRACASLTCVCARCAVQVTELKVSTLSIAPRPVQRVSRDNATRALISALSSSPDHPALSIGARYLMADGAVRGMT